MLRYQAVYHMNQGAFFGVVPGFADVSAIGTSLADARASLAVALRQATERLLRRGQMPPLPDTAPPPGDAYFVEVLQVLPVSEDCVRVEVGQPG